VRTLQPQVPCRERVLDRLSIALVEVEEGGDAVDDAPDVVELFVGKRTAGAALSVAVSKPAGRRSVEVSGALAQSLGEKRRKGARETALDSPRVGEEFLKLLDDLGSP